MKMNRYWMSGLQCGLRRSEVVGLNLEQLQSMAGAVPNLFDFSRNGTLVYHAGRAADQNWPIVWLDSSGKTEPLVTTLAIIPGRNFLPMASVLG
jgi:hypothetical protein